MAYGNGGERVLAPGDMHYMPSGIGADYKTPQGRTPATQMEADRLHKAQEELHLALSALEERLSDVLAPSGPTNANVKTDPRPTSSVALARHLGELADRVEQAGARVKSLMERIEV